MEVGDGEVSCLFSELYFKSFDMEVMKVHIHGAVDSKRHAKVNVARSIIRTYFLHLYTMMKRMVRMGVHRISKKHFLMVCRDS